MSEDNLVSQTCQGPTEVSGWGQIDHAIADLHKPKNEDEIIALLRAIARGPTPRRITFRGGGQSIAGHAINDDIVIELDSPELSAIGDPKEDAEGHYITVGAAAKWGDILAKTAEYGLLPYSIVSTSQATAGGTIAADCLSRSSPIVGREGSHVRSFRLITADGSAIDCRRDDPDPERAELFRAAIGGFGYLGAITQATIDLRPPVPGWKPGRTICVATRVDKALMGNLVGGDWSDFLPRLRERMGTEAEAEGRDGLLHDLMHVVLDEPTAQPTIAWDAVSSAAWYALDQIEALLFRSRYVLDREIDPTPVYQRANGLVTAVTRALVDPTLTEIAQGTLFLVYPEGIYVDSLGDFMFFMENQLTPARAAAAKAGWHLSSVQQTFVLPAVRNDVDPEGIARAASFLELVRPTLFDEPDGPSSLDDMRPSLIDVLYLPADDILLSASRGIDGYAITVSFTQRDGEGVDKLRARLRSLSKRCAELGGRVHFVKNVEVEPEDLDAMYGDAFDRFVAIKRRYDPRCAIRNAFFDRIFRPDQRKG